MRVLVVEDERHLSEALQRGLGAEGFAVDVAPTGTDGLWMAREHSYDAIVLDILLPGANGFEVCRTLRSEGNWTPILMLTAKDGELDEAESLDTGADDFLRKPFSFVVLVARIRALIRRGAVERPAVLQVGPLWLDPSAHRSWISCGVPEGTAAAGAARRAREIDLALTPREFSLLEYLMRHSGTAISKHELLEHVWGTGFDGDPNVVEVYVGYLRRKLAEVPLGSDKGEKPLPHGVVVETVRGVGYRLEAPDQPD
ncbi:MAG: response regulator transcription factor, partial [Actinomycetota bacterium]|nr:response regulator transcription factor [Actinomycetota bacterium]